MQQTNQRRLPSDPPIDVGLTVKLARIKHGWSQGELAARCNFSTSKISRIESGNRAVNLNDLWALARALEVPPQQFGLAPTKIPMPRRASDETKAVAPQVPAQLPMTPQGYVGRRDELARLDRRYRSGTDSPAESGVRLVAITGTTGVGKTTLALRWAHQVTHDFPDGNLHADLRGFDTTMAPLDPSDVLAQFLHSLGATTGASPVTLEAKAALFRSHAARRRLLILLDNAANSDQVRPLLPGSPGCLVIITSRDNLSDLVVREGAKTHVLERMSADEARELLAHRIEPERVRREPEATSDLIDACDGLPLALATVGSHANLRPQFSLRSLATELLESRSRLGTLDSFGSGDLSVRAVVACSYNPLPEDIKRIFRLLSLHPGPDLTVEAAASIAGLSYVSALRMLRYLASTNLLQESSMLRFAYHDLYRELARELASTEETESTRMGITRRILDHYLRSAYSAASRMEYRLTKRPTEPSEPNVAPEDFSTKDEASSWFHREIDVLTRIVDLAADSGFASYTWNFARYLDTYLDFAGDYVLLESIWRTALGAAERVGDLQALSFCHHRIGHALNAQGHPAEGLRELRKALAIRKERNDIAGEARVLLSMVELLDGQGDLESALTCVRQACSLAEDCNDPLLVGQCRNSLAWVLARSGQPEPALPFVDQALRIHREHGHTYPTGVALDTRGYAMYQLRRYDESVHDFTAAIQVWEELGTHLPYARTSERLAHALLALGDTTAARTAAETALSRYRQVDNGEARHSGPVLHFLSQLP